VFVCVTDRLHILCAVALGEKAVPDGHSQLCTWDINRTDTWTHNQMDTMTDISPNLVISGVNLGIFRSQYTDRLNQSNS
jgi:hypothetical protein